ncbi:MAG: transglycosylase SLT domain-containing protein [Thermodesulfovibrionia bacterium]
MLQIKKIQIFIRACSFIFLIVVCPVDTASALYKPPALSTGELQLYERFKKAVYLINEGSYKKAEDILLSFAANDIWREEAYFLLGRLYKQQGFLDRAADYLKSSTVQHFILKDYILKTLADIYMEREKFDKVIEISRQIGNKVLLQDARQSEISALIAMGEKEEGIDVLSKYIKEYPGDWNSKLVLARLLKKAHEKKKAITLLKDIYISTSPLAADALKELEAMNADIFKQEEMFKRAENFFKKHDFLNAEAEYIDILKHINDSGMKDKVMFAIGNCQFKQKKYNAAAESFGLVKSPEAMYWMAIALYRVDDMNGFDMIVKKIEREYPDNEYLAELFLVLANEDRRAGELNKAEKRFIKILNDFPKNAEDTLWGLGWMSYTNGDYEKASKYFLKLTSSVKNNRRYKYFYWRAKSREMLTEDCEIRKSTLNITLAARNRVNNICPEEDDDAYSILLEGAGYYNFLAKIRFRKHKFPDKIEVSMPKMPNGKVYERIEMLKLLGMNEEAADEIKMILKFIKNSQEFKYLGYIAIDVGEYKSIIYFAERSRNMELLPFAYPLGFWNTVEEAAEIEGIDPYLVVALIREESRFDTEAVSVAGAMGLMQLMPFTAHKIKGELEINLKDDYEIYDVRKNIFMGTHYLSLLIGEFKEIHLAVAAYNAGEYAVREWVLNSNHESMDEFIEDIPYRETRRYVKRVLRSYWQYRSMNGLPILGISYQGSGIRDQQTDH